MFEAAKKKKTEINFKILKIRTYKFFINKNRNFKKFNSKKEKETKDNFADILNAV